MSFVSNVCTVHFESVSMCTVHFRSLGTKSCSVTLFGVQHCCTWSVSVMCSPLYFVPSICNTNGLSNVIVSTVDKDQLVCMLLL